MKHLLKLATNSRYFRIFGKVTWSVVDQGANAGTNFLVALLLARYLSTQDYGIYAILVTTQGLNEIVLQGLLFEPMLIFGAKLYRFTFLAYINKLLLISFLFVLAAFPLLVVIFILTTDYQLQSVSIFSSFFVFVLGSTIWLLIRRSAYVVHHPIIAGIGSICFATLALISIFGLHSLNMLSIQTWLIVKGLGNLVISLGVYIFQMINYPGSLRSGENQTIRIILQQHWKYGRWALGVQILSWLPKSIYFYLLPGFVNLDANAALKALMNLLSPFLMTFAAQNPLLLPTLSLTIATDWRIWYRRIKIIFAVSILGAVIYWLILGLGSSWVVDLLYDGKYSEYSDLLWILGGIPVCAAVYGSVGMALKSLEKPKQVFVGWLSSSVIMLSVGILLVKQRGLEGAAFGLLLSLGMAALVLVFQLRKTIMEFINETEPIL